DDGHRTPASLGGIRRAIGDGQNKEAPAATERCRGQVPPLCLGQRGQGDTATTGARMGHWGHYAKLGHPAPNLDLDIDVARSVSIWLGRARQSFVCVRPRRRVGLLCYWGAAAAPAS